MMERIEYIVNGKRIYIRPREFSGGLETKEYVKQIYSALSKIGIEKEFITVDCGGIGYGSWAKVEWRINNEQLSFECSIFKSQYQNMGAIAQAIQDDVRHITRGIKSLWASMQQYKALPAAGETSINKYQALSKKELKKLLMVYHPDTAKGEFDQETFNQIKQALEEKKE